MLFDTPAKELIADSAGQVIGVLATRNGKPFRVKARRAVVITTGGYKYSIPMRRGFLEGPGVKGWAFWGTPANTGDGIEMALRYGARLDKAAKSAAGLMVGIPHGGLQRRARSGHRLKRVCFRVRPNGSGRATGISFKPVRGRLTQKRRRD